MTTATTTTTDNSDSGSFGGSLSADEAKFFETGGESPIPADTGGADTSTAAPGADAGAADAGGNAPEGGDQGTKHVPLSALHEERTKRKALADTVKTLETQLAEVRGKFSVIERLGGPQQPAAAEQPAGMPKPEDDIFGAVNAITKKLEESEAAAKATVEQTRFVNSYREDAAKFTQATPDYMDAYNHLLSSRAAELQAIGYEGAALGQALQADEIAIAEMAFSKGKSPAELLYNLAKQRGYTKKEAAAAAAAAPGGLEKLETIERAQAANKSLSNTGGNSGDQDMTAERLLSMPMDEFESWVSKNPVKAKRIMGG